MSNLLFLLWPLIDSSPNMLFNNVNKTVLRIMTPVTVFVNVWEFQVIVMKFWEVIPFLIQQGAAEFHIASDHI
jgi:hypothetical protein